MAARKKTPARSIKTKMAHGEADSDHRVTLTITIGPLERIPRKTRRKGKKTPKQVKEFLKWAVKNL